MYGCLDPQYIFVNIGESENIIIIKRLYDIYYIIELVNLYRIGTSKWHLGKYVEKYVENIEFKLWCYRWQMLYDSNTNIRLRCIKNIILPFQLKFIKRLWDPHSKLGYI